MRKKLLSLAVVAAVLSMGVVYGGDTPSGKPFQYLEGLIKALTGRVDDLETDTGDLDTRVGDLEVGVDDLDGRVGDIEADVDDLDGRVDDLETSVGSLETDAGRYGTRVAPGLYHVHTRTLWDMGWLSDKSTTLGDHITYNEYPKALVYGNGRTTFLQPLKAYGIPDVQDGAERKVRLYVNYGHQWMCNGTPTVRIGDVEFYLPLISGHYADMGANWSNFRDWEEYGHVGHASIQVYLKNFSYGGSHCGPWPGTNRPKGVIHKIEAHFYDEFPE